MRGILEGWMTLTRPCVGPSFGSNRQRRSRHPNHCAALSRDSVAARLALGATQLSLVPPLTYRFAQGDGGWDNIAVSSGDALR